MGTKKSTVLKKDKSNNSTEVDLNELKKSDAAIKLSSPPDVSDETSQEPSAIPGQSLSVLNKQIKDRLKAEGKSTRVIDSDAQRKNAISRLATALNKRGWISKGVGVYELGDKHKLSIDSDSFKADVDGYILPLGKEALKTLDQYVSLSKVSNDSTSTL